MGEECYIANDIPEDELSLAINFYWQYQQTFSVFMMQIGFAFIEGGSIRKHHVEAILLKNIIDICTGTFTWIICGYAFAHGDSFNHIIGADKYFFSFQKIQNDLDLLGFLKSWAFQSTACTIISGAIAERMFLSAYTIVSICVSAFIYPVAVHWVWNDGGWLKNMGYHDFAGDLPVHIVGGLTGLIATKMLGPRQARFEKQKQISQDYNKLKRTELKPSNIPFVVLGTMILWFSWYGFNAGSVPGSSSSYEIKEIGIVSINTTLSAVCGGLTIYLQQVISVNLNKKKQKDEIVENSKDYKILQIYNKELDTIGVCMGILSGLIGVTAGCDNFKPSIACVVGILSSLFYNVFKYLLEKYEIDDPIDAISLHLGCGIWGVIAVGLLDSDNGCFTSYNRNVECYNSSFSLLGVQLLGLFSVIAWTAIWVYLVVKILKYTNKLRISVQQEKFGYLKILNKGHSKSQPIKNQIKKNSLQETIFKDNVIKQRYIISDQQQKWKDQDSNNQQQHLKNSKNINLQQELDILKNNIKNNENNNVLNKLQTQNGNQTIQEDQNQQYKDIDINLQYKDKNNNPESLNNSDDIIPTEQAQYNQIVNDHFQNDFFASNLHQSQNTSNNHNKKLL